MVSTHSKVTEEFDSLYSVLNPAQRKAVDTVEGPVMVIAGPGTGKTTILTLRIANIIRTTDTAPESILALTFTESGAFAMRRKLTEIIGPSAYKVNIHTFHGFAEHIIQQYPDYFPRIIGSSIITDAEQIKIIEKCIESKKISILRPYGDPAYYVKSVLNEIHLLKRENVSPKRLKESIEEECGATAQRRDFPRLRSTKGKRPELKGSAIDDSNWHETDLTMTTDESKGNAELSKTELEKLEKRDAKNRELQFVYSTYEAQLAKQKYYDFDDMLLELIRAMEGDTTFKLILQEAYQYILADEHQDANASQNRILELLADFHESPNLFIVGDDKQAIYRFQGASLENFLYFSQKYRDVVVIDLEHNYRSHQGILDASHSLILNNPSIPGRERQKLLSLQVGSKPIFVDEFSTVNEELEYVALLISGLLKKSERPEEIAILYRENRDAAAVSEILRAHGVAHRIESEYDIIGEPDVAALIMLCEAIHDPANSELLGQALLLPEMGCDSAEVMEVFGEARKEKKPLHVAIKTLNKGGVKEAYDRLMNWSGEAQTMPFPNFLQKLIQETGLMTSIVSAPNSLERLASLESFFDRIVKAAQSKKTFYLKDFIDYIGIVSKHGINGKRGWSEHIAGVRLMTAHRSKGLEFNHVFIVHAVDGSWGNRLKRNHFTIPVIEQARDAGRIEDERRLFYVAMTRARESVNISYAHSDGEKETVQSQFISEIDPKLIIFGKPKAVDRQSLFVKRIGKPSIDPKAGTSGVKPISSKPDTVNEISILNPGFIRSKFLGQAFSVTHLNNYLKCPWEYFFVNLIRVPQAPTKHQMYGTAVHAALRSFFDAYKDGRDLSKKKLIEIFKHQIERQPMSVDDRRESFKKGQTALGGYYDEYNGTWGRQFITEYAVKGVSVDVTELPNKPGKIIDSGKNNKGDSASLELTGKLDKIEFLNDRQALVTDFKTAKPKSRNDIEGKTRSSEKAGGGNYKRQLVFYKMLLDGAKKFDMKYGEIDFIEPNERGIYKKERFEIVDTEIIELRQTISRVVGEILGLKFLDSACNEKDCVYCRLGKILRR
jgi:DNA helicase-2/ATP-dependent DNA helicase PcrA